MKTFRLIGMALLAVVTCLNFTSCSDDDNEEPERNDDGIVTNQKRLVRIYSNNVGEYIHDFIYDSKGRLSTMFYYNYTYNYTWVMELSRKFGNITMGEIRKLRLFL